MDDAGVVNPLVSRSDDPSDTSSSVSAFLATLIPSLVSFLGMTGVFILLRTKSRMQYLPRTYIVEKWQKTPEPPAGLWNWIPAMFSLPDTHALRYHSLDAYLLLRFLKFVSQLMLIGCCITWPILFPVNVTGGGNLSQLNLLSMSNIAEHSYIRFFVHCAVSWIFAISFFILITREHIEYKNLRQNHQFLLQYWAHVASLTILILPVNKDNLNVKELRKVLESKYHSQVRTLWLAADTAEFKKMIGTVADVDVLELKSSNPNILTDKGVTKYQRYLENWREICKKGTIKLQKYSDSEAGNASLVFIEFKHLHSALSAYESLEEMRKKTVYRAPSLAEEDKICLAPTDFILANVPMKRWERLLRKSCASIFIIGLIIFWAIPTAAIGCMSNVDYLVSKFRFLSFINEAPVAIRGVITGLLPSVSMAILMALVPIIMRLCARFGGGQSSPAIELATQNYYFAFQLVQVFLVVTLSSSATSVITSITQDPQSAPALLATHIPRASNFYVSYVILQGLSFSAGALLQIAGLVTRKALGMLDSNRSKEENHWSNMAGLAWGTIYPPFTLLAVIGIIYSCIAPLVTGFACIGLYLFYFAYRYNVLYVSNATIDTQGSSYLRGLQHLTVGCYLLILSMISIFAIASRSSLAALGPLILMLVLLVSTACYQAFIMNKIVDRSSRAVTVSEFHPAFRSQ